MKILLVDCDGTIRKPKSRAKFINKPNDQKPIPGAVEALNHHVKEGWLIVGVTNQAGVAAGHKSLTNCIKEQRYTLKLFPQLEEILFCPDYDGNICCCVSRFNCETENNLSSEVVFRKPGAGMLLKALTEHQGIKKKSWMIGDRPEDEQAAMSAGINFMWADIWRERWRTGEYRA